MEKGVIKQMGHAEFSFKKFNMLCYVTGSTGGRRPYACPCPRTVADPKRVVTPSHFLPFHLLSKAELLSLEWLPLHNLLVISTAMRLLRRTPALAIYYRR